MKIFQTKLAPVRQNWHMKQINDENESISRALLIISAFLLQMRCAMEQESQQYFTCVLSWGCRWFLDQSEP